MMSKKISLPLAVVMAIIMVLFTVMTTFTAVSLYYRNELREAYLEGVSSVTDSETLSRISSVFDLFRNNSVYEWDEEAALNNMLKAYASSTGDAYAGYFTPEEFAEMTASNNAQTVGIGVSIIPTEAIDGLEIIMVNPESPALEAGIAIGDIITSVVVDGVEKTVAELGYNGAVEVMRGEEGTQVTFSVLRNGEKLSKTVTRRAVTTVSVLYHVCTTDSQVGIVKITGFDTKTPLQFDEAMDSLIAAGCRSFVFDMRHNPGGDLLSVKAVLAQFLNQGDIVLRSVYNDNVEKITYLEPFEPAQTNDYYGCTITKEDMGKYRGYHMAVLAGPNTASAAELFTACLKDYSLVVVVGEVTFGKGIMQSIIPLGGNGGAVKMTSAYYNPPFSENYNGIGIMPDVEVSLDETLSGKNVYKITDEEDNQLQSAIKSLTTFFEK